MSFDIPQVPDANAEKTRIRALLEKESTVEAARSGGAGGQNVNKVSSKAIVIWYPAQSGGFSDEQKALLTERLQNHITKAGCIRVPVDAERDFHRNKEVAFSRLVDLIVQALKQDKERIATEPTKSADERRKDEKGLLAKKKQARSWKPGSDRE